ncbi:MAG: methyltransferase domain-containing protein [Flavobacteriales bacterium]|nr:methyltransferase domain-containing protein [Flavobacteriales bacterium]
MSTNELIHTTKAYYDSNDADEFYHRVWGGEDIHVGIYELPDERIFQASQRTVQQMISMLRYIDENTDVLDIGSGYGGAARYLSSRFKCTVTCLNLSEKENERNRKKNKEVGLGAFIDVHQGNFEYIPFPDNSFNVVWSEDAILHSDNKAKVFHEVSRVLKTGGQFIFTDPMQSDDCPADVLKPVLDRIHLKELGSVKLYRALASANGLEEVRIMEMPEQLVNHYSSVKRELQGKKEELKDYVSDDYITRMLAGLDHWIDGGKKGYLNWGILQFKKSGKA